MLATFIQLYLFVLPFEPFHKKTYNILGQFIIVNFFFVRAAFRNPGLKDPVKNLNFDKLVEKYDAQALCPNCETIYEKDSRHCYICDRCIDKYDHHCQWINNCVGRNNHLSFYLYIASLMVYFIYVDIMCFVHLKT